MRADAFSLDVVLSEKQQWVVPVYQRHYEWETGEDKQLPNLWEDLKDKAVEHLDDRHPYPHFFGAAIFSEPTGQPLGAVRKRYPVDGQQRITTFELVLITLRELAREIGVSRIEDVVNSYLFNEESKRMADPAKERYKLWPSSYDRQLYRHIIDSPRNNRHTFGRRLRAAGVSFEDRQDLLGHRAGRITTHYSAAELTTLIAAAEGVGERKGTQPELVVLRRLSVS
jgi:hypothetical protein